MNLRLPAGLRLVPVLAGTFAATVLFGAQDASLLGTLKINNASLPLYRDGVLDYFMRSQEMTRLGNLFHAQTPVIDSIRPGADVNYIAAYDDPGVYPLYSPVEEVAKFWIGRKFSRGVLTAEQADIDQANRIVSGEGRIFIRSLLMDLDGKGFQADFNTRQATVHHNVRIVLRFGSDAGSLSADSKGEMLKGTSQIKAFSESLSINGAGGVIVLNGAVRVEDARATITADRLELELSQNNQSEMPKNGELGGLGGLDRMRFIGNVHVVRVQTPEEIAKDGVEQLYADRMTYEVATSDLELTGKNPVMMQGKDFIRSERILLNRDRETLRFFEAVRIETRKLQRQDGEPAAGAEVCTITGDYAELDYQGNRAVLNGNAVVDHPAEKIRMTCGSIDVYLIDRDQPPAATASTKAGKAKDAPVLSGDSPLEFSSGGSKKVHSMVCRKAVKLIRTTADGEDCATADTATFFPDEERILMQGSPVLGRNQDQISGGEMEYFIAKEQLLVRNGSQVTLDSVRIDPQSRKIVQNPAAGGQTKPLIVKSRSSDLNFGGNLLTFDQQVDADNQTQKLTCDKLELQLADAAGADAGKSPAPAAKEQPKKAPDAVGSKKLIAAVCTGKVAGSDPQSRLFCDKLDLAFGETAVPGKTDLEKITATGNVKMESVSGKKPKKAKKRKKKKVQDGSLFSRNPEGTTSLQAQRGVIDLLTNVGDFYENVRIADPENELTCDHLHLIGGFTDEEIPQIGSIRRSDEEELPDRIGIGSGRELLRVIADKHVRLRRVVKKTQEVQKVTGDHADYVVADRTVVLTGTPEKRPEAVATGGKTPGGMVGDKVIVYLDTEDIEVERGESLTRSGNFGF